MQVDSDIIFELAHKTTKQLGLLVNGLDLYDMSSKGELLRSETTRKHYARLMRALIGSIMDLRHLAMCDEKDGVAPIEKFNWKQLIHKNLSDSSHWSLSKSLTWEGEDEDYEGSGHLILLKRAVGNLSWFNEQFWKEPAKVKLSLLEKDGRPWINCVWDFVDAVSLDPKFPSFEPFYSMDPKDDSLDNTTGLALYCVKKTLEIHGGTLTADMSKGLMIWLSCPKDLEDQKAGAKAAA